VVLYAGNVGIFRGAVVRDCNPNAHCVAIAKPVADTEAQSDAIAKPIADTEAQSDAIAKPVADTDPHSFGHTNPRISNRDGQ
jgi:hypothetical protein